MTTSLPYIKLVDKSDDASKAGLQALLLRALEASKTRPMAVEVRGSREQRFLFFREGQIYGAGMVAGDAFSSTTIREFLIAPEAMNFPTLALYELNNKILHSILILFQKKPTVQVQTSLVDLDEVLDRIEADGKTCVVAGVREDFVAMLRYEKGRATALCFGESLPTPRESSFRDEFLVQIYTITTETPLTINVFEDLMVSYATDAKTVPDGFSGSFEELYLAKPPMLSLRFRGREIDHWVLDRPVTKIGRTPDNDICIDNLAVSRLHAVIEQEKGAYYVKDCDSLNGTQVNGNRVGRAKLEDQDVIQIGKHEIRFQRQGGQTITSPETIQGFDQTIIINASDLRARAQEPVAQQPEPNKQPHLVMKTEYGDRVIEITDSGVSIGKDLESDVAIDGMFVAKKHVYITVEKDRVILRHLGGLRKVTVGGRPVREIELQDNDEIRIASEEFVFHN